MYVEDMEEDYPRDDTDFDAVKNEAEDREYLKARGFSDSEGGSMLKEVSHGTIVFHFKNGRSKMVYYPN